MTRLNNQELLSLCAAACGPLTWGEKEWICAEMRNKQPSLAKGDFPAIGSQPDFPELLQHFQTHEPLRQLCAAVMNRRQTPQSSREYMPIGLRYIAAARYALLCGDSSSFYDMHYRYGKTLRLPRMLKEPELIEFWSGVLGRSWRGIEYLPEGSVRRELLAMLALHYAMAPRQEDLVPEMARDLPLGLGLGYALLRADNRLAPTQEHAPEAEQELALAYWKLWAGGWQHAYKGFKAYFKNRRVVYSRLSEEHCEGVLVVACIVAIRVGAPQRVVEQWLGIARDMVDQSFSLHSSSMKADLHRFFDGLALWDAVQNRNLRPQTLPEPLGPLAGAALSMAAQALGQHTGLNLPVEAMVAAVLEVEAQGLHLLAAYAASSLLYLPDLSAEAQASLSRVRDACTFAPLFPRPEADRPRSTGDRSRLSMLLENTLTQWADSLYWDLTLDTRNNVVAIEPRMVEGKPQTTGKRVELGELMSLVGLSSNSSLDLAVAGLAEALSRSSDESVPLLATVLSGHPRLRLVLGNYRRLVQVQTHRPVIRVDLVEANVRLALDAGQFTRLQEQSESLFSIAAYPPQMQTIMEYFRNGPLLVDIASKEELRWIIFTLGEYFAFEGQVPETLLSCTASDSRLVMQASPDGAGYHFELKVQHLAGVEAFSIPGQGLAALLLQGAEGKLQCVKRDKARELAAASAIVQRCTQLRCVSEGQSRYHWRLSSRDQALQTICELRENRVEFSWLGAAEYELHVAEAAASAMRYTVRREHADWLELGADLQVDEDRVIELSELLRAYRREGGPFIRLRGENYLHISAELAYILDRLQDSLRTEGKKHLLPRAALPALAGQWQGELPSFLRLCNTQLHECDDAPAPLGLAATLREYQLEGYRWLLARMRAGLGACLADDMGLGKTLQALALLQECAPGGPSLVVAPLSLCSNWQSEAARFAPELRLRVYSGSLGELRAGDVVVASYGQVVANAELFSAVEWNLLALDEAQAIKNPASRRAQVVCRLRASGRVCLTGTPVENSLMDLWSLMHFLNPYLLGPRSQFARPSQEQVEKMRRLVAPLVLRRTKQQVLEQLPPITEVKIGVELNAEERALYESIRREALNRDGGEGAQVALLAELTRLRRSCCHGKLVLKSFRGASSKMNALTELVESLSEAGHKALVFSQFTDVLDLAQAALQERSFTTLRLDGSTPASKRKKAVDAFQNGEAQVFLISLKAGGFGLNLTAADYVILLDPWWNPAVEAQAAGRSHRMGQRNPVTLCRLIANHTVEEIVVKMHEAKQLLAESVIHEGSMPLSKLREILSYH